MKSTLLRKFQNVKLLKFIPIFAVLALGAWAYASPVGSSPDDDFHLTSIWCASSSKTDICAAGDTSATRKVPEILLQSPCFAYKPELSADCQGSIGYSMEPQTETDRGNFAGGYPPVYYAVMNLFAAGDIQTSVLLMRFANIFLCVGLLAGTFIALPRNRRGTLVWSWLITSVPLSMFLIASNNPSSWAVIGVGTSWIAFLGFLESTGQRRIGLGLLTLVSTVVAAGARADAAVYAVIGFAVVLFLKFKKSIVSWKVLGLLGLAILACIGFYLSSTQALSAINGFGNPVTAVGGFGGEIENVSTEKPSLFALLAFNILNAPMLWEGIWGSWGLGWLDTDLPSIVYLGSVAAFVGIAFIGFGNLNKRKMWSLAGIGLALWLMPVWVLTKGGSHIGMEVQPRYLLPLVVLFAGVLLLKVRQSPLGLTRAQAYLVAATLTIANFVALHFNMRRYITGIDSMGWNLNQGMEWWWPGFISPMVVLLAGAVAFGVLAFTIAREVPLSVSENSASSTDSVKSIA